MKPLEFKMILPAKKRSKFIYLLKVRQKKMKIKQKKKDKFLEIFSYIHLLSHCSGSCPWSLDSPNSPNSKYSCAHEVHISSFILFFTFVSHVRRCLNLSFASMISSHPLGHSIILCLQLLSCRRTSCIRVFLLHPNPSTWCDCYS